MSSDNYILVHKLGDMEWTFSEESASDDIPPKNPHIGHGMFDTQIAAYDAAVRFEAEAEYPIEYGVYFEQDLGSLKAEKASERKEMQQHIDAAFGRGLASE